MSLIHELKRRHVFRVGIAYAACGWVVLQFASIFTPALNLPQWTNQVLLWIGVAGFPLALWLAWTFQVTQEGIKRTEDVAPDELIAGLTRGKLNRAIVSLLIAALVLVLAERLLLQEDETQASPSTQYPTQTDP